MASRSDHRLMDCPVILSRQDVSLDPGPSYTPIKGLTKDASEVSLKYIAQCDPNTSLCIKSSGARLDHDRTCSVSDHKDRCQSRHLA